MSSVGSMVLLQAMYYGIVMVFTLAFCGVLQRGFFWKYIKVRTSFGRLVMVKVRSPLRDYFEIGEVEEGFLIYKHKIEKEKCTIRLNIPQNISPFYKAMSITWVDVDDEKHAISTTDYSAVTGYDAVKNDNLHVRALMRPSLVDGKQKIMMLLIIGAILVGVLATYMGYVSYKETMALKQALPGMLNALKGTVVGGPMI